MLLANLVETSRRVAATSKRLEKTALISSLLQQLNPEEVEVAVHYLSGSTRQGRIGIGYATLRDAVGVGAGTPTLEILEVDRFLDQLAGVSGPGSESRRREILQQLFSKGTPDENDFLTRLLIGELRQGALEGLMLDAIARGSGISLDRIRRAAMTGGGGAAIARAVFEGGAVGLDRFGIELFRPIQPMLAQ